MRRLIRTLAGLAVAITLAAGLFSFINGTAF
jgi:hypothetical protein